MPIAAPVGIELTDDERDQLESWARRRTSAQALALRSRIVLLAADGLNNTEIAKRLGLSGVTWVKAPFNTIFTALATGQKFDAVAAASRSGSGTPSSSARSAWA